MDKSIHTQEYKRLCELLRRLRDKAGLTQAQLAERIEEPQSFVSKYERGERRLDVIEVRHIAVELGMNLLEVVAKFEADAPPLERATESEPAPKGDG